MLLLGCHREVTDEIRSDASSYSKSAPSVCKLCSCLSCVQTNWTSKAMQKGRALQPGQVCCDGSEVTWWMTHWLAHSDKTSQLSDRMQSTSMELKEPKRVHPLFFWPPITTLQWISDAWLSSIQWTEAWFDVHWSATANVTLLDWDYPKLSFSSLLLLQEIKVNNHSCMQRHFL